MSAVCISRPEPTRFTSMLFFPAPCGMRSTRTFAFFVQ
jgi:hypothetical protein